MKTFRYKLGHKYFDTLTVGEMKRLLKAYNDDVPLIATWEGIFTPFRMPEIDEKFDTGNSDDTCKSLIFDVNYY